MPAPDAPTPADHDDGERRVREIEGALHDVANALTVVVGWLDVAQKQKRDAGDHEALDIARDWSRHARIVALRAIGSDRSLSDDAQNSETLAREAAAGVEPEALSRNVVVRVQPSGDLAETGVKAPSRARQVLTNLLLNGIAFSPSGSQILMSVCRTSSGMVRFVVSDEGPGIAADRRATIFNGVASTRKNGCGIGLQHSHRIAQEEGGELRLLDVPRGACFELCWPSELVVADRRLRPRSSKSLRGATVLVVEDDPAVIALLETALEARGAQVISASTEAALDTVLARSHFDAALVDLSPIEHDVVGALRRIRRADDRRRVVLISGAPRPPEPEALARASAWVRKPFEISEVVAALLGE